MKKHLLFLFAALLPLLASAQIKVQAGSIYYNLTSYPQYAAEVVQWESTRYKGSITIPPVITYLFNEYIVTSIGESAFCDCGNLTSITIPESVTSIGNSAFARCISLTSITLPEGVTSIGNGAFFDCRSLTFITIPEGVTSIGEKAFYRCSSLTTIVLPKNVNSIGSEAFVDCPELTDVYCHAESVLTIEADAFNNYYLKYATLHVPANAINSYKKTAPWSSFGKIVSIEGDDVEKCATPTISYEGGKVVFVCDTEGATIKSNVKENIAGDYNDVEFDFIPIYTITVYATKENYEDSDEATFTLCWVPCPEEHESEEDGILTIPAQPVLIQCADGVITLTGLTENTEVAVYATAGNEIATTTASAGSATIYTSLETGTIAIVKIEDYRIKIAIK